MKKMIQSAAVLLLLATLNSQLATVHAQGTAFTYQGRLNNNGSPASGIYNLTFSLFNTNSSGAAIAGPVTNNAVVVTNGLFTVLIDFGPGVFTGATNWLEIAVATNGGNTFTTLAPRQQLTPTPYAIFAGAAGGLSGTLPVSQVSGVLPLAQLPAAVITNYATSVTLVGYFTGNFGGSFYGNGSGLTGLNPADLSAGTAAINISGNAATATTATTATNLIGNVSDAQLSANIARLNGTNNFTGTNTFAGVTIATNVNNVIAGTILGNGSGLTNLNTAQFANSVLTNGETGVTLGGTFNGNATTANNFSGSLSGNVTGTQSATVVSTVGGQTAANVASGASAANAATSANTASTIVKRDASGNFTASTITANLTGNATTANGFSGSLAGDVTGTQSATVVASVGGQTAANVASGVSAANAATSAATGNTIVKRDASGSFTTTNLTLNGSLVFSNAAVDTIYSGSSTLLIDDYNNQNFYAGYGAGNFNGDSFEYGGNYFNVGVGFMALPAGQIVGSYYNTAIGAEALYDNTSGADNTACGAQALYSNNNGFGNTASGYYALYDNTSGGYNTASGASALQDNTSGNNNTAVGTSALIGNRSGNGNIALGYQAGFNLTTESNNICIGNLGMAFDNGVIRIGTPGTHNTTYLAGMIQVSSNLFMNDHDIQLRNDLNQGVGWYGTGKLFSGVNVDGPVLYGYSGGGLGYHNNNYGTNLVLYWNNSGHVGIGNTSPGYLLVVGTGGAYCNGTTWVNGSDRNSKEDFAAVNPREVLAKVSALPITEWKYKAEADGSKHLGPMAQDFHAAFGLNGPDDKHIATVDESGVALAAIQGLNQKVEEKDAEIQELKQSVAELKAMVEKLAGK
jgi:hypothetical protein